MNALGITSEISFEVLRIIITSTVASTTIGWWIWVVHCTLGQLRSHQIGFVELLFECFRALCVVLSVLTVIAFL